MQREGGMLRRLSPIVMILTVGGAALVCGAICVVMSLLPAGSPTVGPNVNSGAPMVVTAQSVPFVVETDTPESKR